MKRNEKEDTEHLGNRSVQFNVAHISRAVRAVVCKSMPAERSFTHELTVGYNVYVCVCVWDWERERI